jgi:hypothetical protein
MLQSTVGGFRRTADIAGGPYGPPGYRVIARRRVMHGIYIMPMGMICKSISPGQVLSSCTSSGRFLKT